jgi:hypothetical protein
VPPPCRDRRVPVLAVPREPDPLALGRRLGLALLHRSKRRRRIEVQPRVLEEVCRRRDDPAGSVRRPPDGPGPRDLQVRPVAGATDDQAFGHHLPRPEGPLGHPERAEDELLHDVLVRAPGHALDRVTREHEAGVVVRPELTERRQLRKRGHASDVARCRVVAPARVVEVVADPAAGVREEMPQRDAAAGRRGGEGELGDVLAHRRVEVEQTLVDEQHHGRPGERLRDRSRLEACARRDGQRVLDARDAERLVPLLAAVEDADATPGTPSSACLARAASNMPTNQIYRERTSRSTAPINSSTFSSPPSRTQCLT